MSNKLKLFKIWYFLATGCGISTISISLFIPPGTMASLMAIPIWWVLVYYFSYKVYFIFLFFSIIIGIYFCGEINKINKIHDDKSIVWDELIGMWITLIVVPINCSWLWIVLWIIVAFLLFRALDIIKPWPISWADRVILGGVGIIIDDILASVGSICIILFLMQLFD